MKLDREKIERRMEALEADEWEVGIGPDGSVVVMFSNLGSVVRSIDAGLFEAREERQMSRNEVLEALRDEVYNKIAQDSHGDAVAFDCPVCGDFMFDPYRSRPMSERVNGLHKMVMKHFDSGECARMAKDEGQVVEEGNGRQDPESESEMLEWACFRRGQ